MQDAFCMQGNVKMSLVIVTKSFGFLGTSSPDPYRAWATETGGSCLSNFDGGACNANFPPPYDFDQHKCSAAIIFFSSTMPILR